MFQGDLGTIGSRASAEDNRTVGLHAQSTQVRIKIPLLAGNRTGVVGLEGRHSADHTKAVDLILNNGEVDLILNNGFYFIYFFINRPISLLVIIMGENLKETK